MRVLTAVLVLLAAVCSFAANIEVVPAQPTTATPVTLIVEESVSCPPAPHISSVANTFTIKIDPGICLSPPVNAKFNFPLGTLPPGTYQVVVDRGDQHSGQATFVVRDTASEPSTAIRFEPPNPTSRTPVIAQVSGAVNACVPDNANVSRIGSEIGISVIFPPGCGDALPAIIPFTLNVDLGVLPAGVYRVRAAPDRFNVSLGDSTLVVHDANPPFTVSPNVGYVIGTTLDRVTLFGKGIASCDDMPICIPPAVKFGNALARVERVVTQNEIEVTPPSNIAGIYLDGPVDVTIESGTRTHRSTAAFLYVSGDRPRPEFFERVLLPVVFAGPGGFGSQWETEVSMDNSGPYPLTTGVSSMFDVLCFPICDHRPPVGSRTLKGHNYPNGHLVFLPRQDAPNVHFGVLVKDLSRQSEALGTEIPVVRENDLHNRPFELLNVPSDSRYRVTLRIYDVESPRFLHLLISKMGSTAPLVNTSVQLTGPGPAYFAINDLVSRFPELQGQGNLRIVVEPMSLPPVTPRSIWGFVSITNNTTQHVTVISPQ